MQRRIGVVWILASWMLLSSSNFIQAQETTETVHYHHSASHEDGETESHEQPHNDWSASDMVEEEPQDDFTKIPPPGEPGEGAVGQHEAAAGREESRDPTANKEAKRIWGAAGSGATTSASIEELHTGDDVDEAEHSPKPVLEPNADVEVPTTNNKTTKTAFVSKPKTAAAHHSPPEGYALSARIYIDPNDKLAHFDDDPPVVPYWDCGYAGSTTSPLPLKSAYFRHALTGATSWSGTDGKHAVLVVVLAPLAMDLNSGETREFAAGQVILLEDVLLPGHKMRPLHSNSLSVLFLTLPNQHVHAGKEYVSLPAAFLKHFNKDDPCPSQHFDEIGVTDQTNGNSELMLPPNPTFSWTPQNLRRTALAMVGFSLSTLAADFLGKTAPLWLAVGVGGTCFVMAGTWAMAVGGDALWAAAELAWERRKLGQTSLDPYEDVGGSLL